MQHVHSVQLAVIRLKLHHSRIFCFVFLLTGSQLAFPLTLIVVLTEQENQKISIYTTSEKPQPDSLVMCTALARANDLVYRMTRRVNMSCSRSATTQSLLQSTSLEMLVYTWATVTLTTLPWLTLYKKPSSSSRTACIFLRCLTDTRLLMMSMKVLVVAF